MSYEHAMFKDVMKKVKGNGVNKNFNTECNKVSGLLSF